MALSGAAALETVGASSAAASLAATAGTAGLESTIMAGTIGAESITAGSYFAGSSLAAILPAVGTAAKWLSVGSTIVSGFGSYQAGKAQEASLQSQADQEKVKANQEAAAGEEQMAVENRNTELAMSKVTADAAAGGGALDPSVVHLLGDLQTQGKENEYNTLYNSQNKANADTDQATMDRFQASQDSKAGTIGAVASVFKAGSQSMFDKYNGAGVYG